MREDHTRDAPRGALLWLALAASALVLLAIALKTAGLS
jgi:hypothetical protein